MSGSTATSRLAQREPSRRDRLARIGGFETRSRADGRETRRAPFQTPRVAAVAVAVAVAVLLRRPPRSFDPLVRIPSLLLDVEAEVQRADRLERGGATRRSRLRRVFTVPRHDRLRLVHRREGVLARARRRRPRARPGQQTPVQRVNVRTEFRVRLVRTSRQSLEVRSERPFQSRVGPRVVRTHRGGSDRCHVGTARHRRPLRLRGGCFGRGFGVCRVCRTRALRRHPPSVVARGRPGRVGRSLAPLDRLREFGPGVGRVSPRPGGAQRGGHPSPPLRLLVPRHGSVVDGHPEKSAERGGAFRVRPRRLRGLRDALPRRRVVVPDADGPFVGLERARGVSRGERHLAVKRPRLVRFVIHPERALARLPRGGEVPGG